MSDNFPLHYGLNYKVLIKATKMCLKIKLNNGETVEEEFLKNTHVESFFFSDFRFIIFYPFQISNTAKLYW